MPTRPSPPGPPPPHYRPPGTPPPTVFGPPAGGGAGDEPAPGAWRPGTAALVIAATVVLCIGLSIGFTIGRGFESQPTVGPAVAAPSTTPDPDVPPGDTIPPTPPPSTEPAEPGTELDTSPMGTESRPIPFRQSWVLGIFELEVLDVDRNALAALRVDDPEAPEPPTGMRHVLVEVSITISDDRTSGNPSALPFALVSGTSRFDTDDNLCGPVVGSVRDTGTLAPRASVTATVCFTVPEAAVDSMTLVTDGFAGDIHFALDG